MHDGSDFVEEILASLDLFCEDGRGGIGGGEVLEMDTVETAEFVGDFVGDLAGEEELVVQETLGPECHLWR